MKDFEPIDWKQYNKPPFYQQWLCADDTLKLATFGDKNLDEISQQILKLKDMWGIDDIEGALLDRIGKLLSRPRQGADDKYYRILLKLKILLNHGQATVNDIIKAIKFIYSSEVVHIVPNYPAGLIIEHDGEGTGGLNFNKIIAEIIGAGIGYSTKELFYFHDLLPLVEFDTKTVRKDDIDADILGGKSAKTGLFHNGRILRDGHTVLDHQLGYLTHNGTQARNGFRNRGPYSIPASGRLRLPPRYGSGARDLLWMDYHVPGFTDTLSRLSHNGEQIRNGAARYHGKAPRMMNDKTRIGKRFHYFHSNRFIRDGSITRKGMILIPIEE